MAALLQITQPQRRIAEADAAEFQHQLAPRIAGEVRVDPGSRAMYAVDASNYRHPPIAVVVPRSKADVIETVRACRERGWPVLSRGGGTSLAGQCCNRAVVLDGSKYLNHIVEVNVAERYARVSPGVTCDQLRHRALRDSGNLLNWGPDPATHNHCCFGGMIGNNSCGSHAQMSGKTDNNVEELEVLLYDGTQMTLGWTTAAAWTAGANAGGTRGRIHRQLDQLRQAYAPLIREKFPPIPRRVSGYNLDQLLPAPDGRFNPARSLVGSEGTLVTILEAKVRLMDARAQRVLLVLGYEDLYQAADQVPELNQWQPTALEGMDERLFENIEKKGGPHRKYLKLLPPGRAWLIVEFGADHKSESRARARALMAKLRGSPRAPSMKLYSEQESMHHLWLVRESGLGATAFVPGEPDTWPGWEDSAVAPDQLAGYLRGLRGLYNKYEYNPALYGHFGQGCVHCRVDFDLTSTAGLHKWRSFMNEATELCVRHDGSLSGEHGDGQARAEFLQTMFGPELIKAFRQFKAIWDPDGGMNPGRIVDAPPFDANLRLGVEYRPAEPATHFKFPEDHGSFAHAALRCVGIGKCRRHQAESPDDDVMCPSFMVIHEERDTTRGRAHHLWEMLHGDLIRDGWRDDNVKRSLDLCLSCKGCKGDCPVNVDMATYKAEFLSHYWEGRLRPRSAYAFGWIDRWARLASLAPGLVNLATQTPLLRDLAKWAAGMPARRTIPEFAPTTFQSWFRRRRPPADGAHRPQVLLWADTFNNYFHPETARAAVSVLEAAGYAVRVPEGHLCCGRPLYDYGFLDMAKGYLNRVLAALDPVIAAGTPMVVLEPSCCSVFRDELNGLMPESAAGHRLMENTFLLSEFLQEKVPAYRPPALTREAIVQGHCHHKSIMRFNAEKALLGDMGMDAKLLNSGCCGMAGSFGFERDKYDVSVKCGERVLLPAVRKAPKTTFILADGFSCRAQISELTSRRALHLAEVLQMAAEGAPADGRVPEAAWVAKRRRAQTASRIRTLSALAAVTAAVAWWWRRPRARARA